LFLFHPLTSTVSSFHDNSPPYDLYRTDADNLNFGLSDMDESKSLQSRFAHALRNQKGQAEHSPTGALKFPFQSTISNNHGRILQGFEQLYDHVKADYTPEPELQGLAYRESRAKVKEMLKLR
jgi:hypothetical protein